MLKFFRINIFIRVIVLLILMLGASYSVSIQNYVLAFPLVLFLAIAVGSLIAYVNQTNKDLANFFESVQYDDFTANTSTVRKGDHFEDLHESFNMINRKFIDVRAEKEANHQFLQALVQHIDIGLLCIDGNKEVILMNHALQSLLHKSYLKNVDSLKKVDEQLWETVQSIEGNDRELIKVNIQNNLLQLSIQAVDIKLQDEMLRLISFQDIQNEMEAQELMAWQKLIRILTHEIMNSVAPISSLSATLNSMMANTGQLEGQALDQVKKSLAVIEKRSQGLMAFTETYRTLTRIPPPNFQILDAKSLIESVHTLLKTQLSKANVQFETDFSKEKLPFKGDPHLLEQVLINILKNSIEAIDGKEMPQIKINAFQGQNGKIGIQIQDNGEGIDAEKVEQIFIPFYTTKEQGSGIGLSLSRQIIQMHKGTIELQSEKGLGTIVTIFL